MNYKHAIIAVAIAILAGMALLLTRGAQNQTPPPPPSTWIATFDPLTAGKLSIQSRDFAVTLFPSPFPDVWISESLGEKWPVALPRVRGIFKLISELQPSAPPKSGGTSTTSTGLTVRIDGPKGHIGSLQISDIVLGGRRSVQILDHADQPVASTLVDDNFGRLFERAGLLAWREATPLVSIPGETTQIHVQSGPLEVAGKRVRNQWGITSPVVAPADAAFVHQAILSFHAMAATRFIPATESQSLSFDPPAATIRVHTRLPDLADGSRQELVQEAAIGVAADTAAKSAFVRAHAIILQSGPGNVAAREVPAWGPVVMVVDRESISRITPDPRAYVSKVSSVLPVADIMSLQVRPAHEEAQQADGTVISRTLDGWTIARPGTQPTPLSKDSADAVVNLLNSLCQTPSTDVTFAAPEGTLMSLAVSLNGSKGPLGNFEIGRRITEQPSSVTIVIHTRGVWREYPPETFIPFLAMCEEK